MCIREKGIVSARKYEREGDAVAYVPVTSCRPNVLWEFVRIGRTGLPPGSLGAAFGCVISISAVVTLEKPIGVASQVPVAAGRRLLCL
jgi:hypothetical protein